MEREDLRPLAGGELQARGLPLGGDRAIGERRLAHRIGGGVAGDDVERADRERDQVGGERLRRGEFVDGQPAARRAVRDLGGVGEHLLRGRRGDRQRERRLEAGFVERREHAARVDRLELRPGVPIVADLGAVQPLAAGHERRVIVEGQRDAAGGQRVVEVEPRDARGVDLRVAGGEGALAGGGGDAGDGQFVAMQVERAGGAGDLRVDFGMAGEARLRRVDGQREAIGGRARGVGQAAERHFRRLGGGGHGEQQRRGGEQQGLHRINPLLGGDRNSRDHAGVAGRATIACAPPIVRETARPPASGAGRTRRRCRRCRA